jgi:hypothetical protein
MVVSAQIEIVADSLTYCSYNLFRQAGNHYVFLTQADYEESEIYEENGSDCLPFEVDFDSNILVAFLHNASNCDRRIVESRLSMVREGYLIEFCPQPNVCRDGSRPVIAWFVLPKSVQDSKILVERKPCQY